MLKRNSTPFITIPATVIGAFLFILEYRRCDMDKINFWERRVHPDYRFYTCNVKLYNNTVWN